MDNKCVRFPGDRLLRFLSLPSSCFCSIFHSRYNSSCMGDNLTITTPLGLTFALKLFLNVPRFLCSNRSRAFAKDVARPIYKIKRKTEPMEYTEKQATQVLPKFREILSSIIPVFVKIDGIVMKGEITKLTFTIFVNSS